MAYAFVSIYSFHIRRFEDRFQEFSTLWKQGNTNVGDLSMSFNNFIRHRGSKSAIQATIAGTNSQRVADGGFEVDSHSINSFDDIRVLNDPDLHTANTISEESKCMSNVTNNNCEVRSDEFALLSSASSSSESMSGLGQNLPMLHPIQSDNSQKIDEWCMNNELNHLTEERLATNPLTNLRVQDIVNSWGIDSDNLPLEQFTKRSNDDNSLKGDYSENYTTHLLKKLNDEQLCTVKQLTRELLPLLRNSRRTHSAFLNRFRDIPSMFSHRDLIIAYSLQYNDSSTSVPMYSRKSERFSSVCLDDARSNSSSFNSKSWPGWTLVPRLMENDIS